MASASAPLLLSILELGGYPNFVPLYRRLGFRVEVVTSGRKAIAFIKRETPAVVMAEFNCSPDFRDRTSNLESILALLQRHPQTRVYAFYERGVEGRLEQLRVRFPDFTPVALPVDEARLEGLLTG